MTWAKIIRWPNTFQVKQDLIAEFKPHLILVGIKSKFVE